MRRSPGPRIARLWAAALAAALLVGLVPKGASADPPPPALDADIKCVVEGTAAVCRVTARPSLNSHITYARADVLQAPSFLKVLIGSVDFSEQRDKRQKLALAFVGKSKGSGDVVVKVQAMVCADNGTSCPGLSRVVTGRITIGP